MLPAIRKTLIVIGVGILLLIGSFLPLELITERDPYSMPVQLALLSFFGMAIGVVVALTGFVRFAIVASRELRRGHG